MNPTLIALALAATLGGGSKDPQPEVVRVRTTAGSFEVRPAVKPELDKLLAGGTSKLVFYADAD